MSDYNSKSIKSLYHRFNIRPRFFGGEIPMTLTMDRYILLENNGCGYWTIGLKPFELAHKQFTINKFTEIASEFYKGNKYVIQTINFRNQIELIPLLDIWVKKNSGFYKVEFILKNHITNIEKSFDHLTDQEVKEIKDVPEASDEGHHWKFSKFILKDINENISKFILKDINKNISKSYKYSGNYYDI